MCLRSVLIWKRNKTRTAGRRQQEKTGQTYFGAHRSLPPLATSANAEFFFYVPTISRHDRNCIPQLAQGLAANIRVRVNLVLICQNRREKKKKKLPRTSSEPNPNWAKKQINFDVAAERDPKHAASRQEEVKVWKGFLFQNEQAHAINSEKTLRWPFPSQTNAKVSERTRVGLVNYGEGSSGCFLRRKTLPVLHPLFAVQQHSEPGCLFSDASFISWWILYWLWSLLRPCPCCATWVGFPPWSVVVVSLCCSCNGPATRPQWNSASTHETALIGRRTCDPEQEKRWAGGIDAFRGACFWSIKVFLFFFFFFLKSSRTTLLKSRFTRGVYAEKWIYLARPSLFDTIFSVWHLSPHPYL